MDRTNVESMDQDLGFHIAQLVPWFRRSRLQLKAVDCKFPSPFYIAGDLIFTSSLILDVGSASKVSWSCMQKGLCSVSRLHSHRPSAWHNLSFALRLRHYSAQPGNTTRQEPDYTNLIDPSSLRNTLDAVREANRARLIKKVDQDGTISQLQSLAVSNGNPKSQWLTDHSHLRASPEHNDETPKEADGDQGPMRFGRIKRVKLPSVVRHLDHAGLVLPVQSEWRASKGLTQRWRLPWLSHKNPAELTSAVSARERLAEEINSFNDYFTPKDPEKLASDAALNAIKLALTSIRPSYSIELMGSRASGLASPLSDLDINLRAEDGARLDDVDDRTQAVKILAKINRDLRRLRWTRELRVTSFRSKARVPIIAGVHIPTGLAFQVQHTVTGYNSTEFSRAFVKEYPTLRALFIILKHMLTMRGLCDGQHGGLTSYPLLNMIVACLKLKTAQSDDRDVASHLLSFLDMYSEIDLSMLGISVSPPSYIPLSLVELNPGIHTQLDPGEMESAQDPATDVSVESSGDETGSFLHEGQLQLQEEEDIACILSTQLIHPTIWAPASTRLGISRLLC